MESIGFFSEKNCQPSREVVIDHDGEVILYRNFFGMKRSDRYFTTLLNETLWRQDHIQLFERSIPLPRLTAWYGDRGRNYAYSGIHMEPIPWTPTLLEIKSRIEPLAEVEFNSVLINLYRNGCDSVAWHSDDEPELGQNPVIGSVSFGATRRFSFKHKWERLAQGATPQEPLKPISVDLTSGSFLLMRGKTQHAWLHQIPKTQKIVQPRINLTFRVIS